MQWPDHRLRLALERPAEEVPVNWEGDLISGSANTDIATLVERRTRYLLLLRVSGKDPATAVDASTAEVQSPRA